MESVALKFKTVKILQLFRVTAVMSVTVNNSVTIF